ncbi:MAG: glutamate--tRNA ligase, partial [Rhodothermales bacterium]
NEQHIRLLPREELLERARPYLPPSADDGYLMKIIDLLVERITFVRDLESSSLYFFEDPEEYEEAGVQKRWKEDSAELVSTYADRLDALEEVTAADAEEILRQIGEERGAGAGRIIHPTRLAVTGLSFGPSLFHLMEVIGKVTCVRRMREAAMRLG